MTGIPTCESCDVQHPWLLGINPMVDEVTWTCNECGHQQTTTPDP